MGLKNFMSEIWDSTVRKQQAISNAALVENTSSRTIGITAAEPGASPVTYTDATQTLKDLKTQLQNYDYAKTLQLPVIAPQPVEAVRASLKQKITHDNAFTQVLWSKVIPYWLLTEHPGIPVCVVFSATRESLPLGAFYYRWDLPSLTHVVASNFSELIIKSLRSEKDGELAAVTFAKTERVMINISGIPSLISEFVEELDETELRQIINPYNEYGMLGQSAGYNPSDFTLAGSPPVPDLNPQIIGYYQPTTTTVGASGISIGGLSGVINK